MSERTRTQRKKNETPEQERVPPVVHEVLSSSGQPLDASTRAYMEPRFGHDFSGVRVHTDERAAESAQAVNALAYTVGQDVVFGSGQYTPGTSEGQRLLAHELTHTLQQERAGSTSTGTAMNIGESEGSLEQEAKQASNQVMQTGSGSREVIPTVGLMADGAIVQRSPAAVAAVEVIGNLASVASLAGQVYQGGSGGLSYTSDAADRLSEPTHPKNCEYAAVCLDIVAEHPLYPNVYAAFKVEWEGNDYGEIGAAKVRVDIEHTSEFMLSALNVKFNPLRNLIQPGGDKRTWQMQWDYEGTFDPRGPGEYWFSGRFAIDAFGNYKVIRHTVRDLSIGWGGDSAEKIVRAGSPISFPIPLAPSMQSDESASEASPPEDYSPAP